MNSHSVKEDNGKAAPNQLRVKVVFGQSFLQLSEQPLLCPHSRCLDHHHDHQCRLRVHGLKVRSEHTTWMYLNCARRPAPVTLANDTFRVRIDETPPDKSTNSATATDFISKCIDNNTNGAKFKAACIMDRQEEGHLDDQHESRLSLRHNRHLSFAATKRTRQKGHRQSK
eukprot:938721-Rhodomonas_salina.1